MMAFVKKYGFLKLYMTENGVLNFVSEMHKLNCYMVHCCIATIARTVAI
jgi:hypothetical protein